MTVGHVVLSVLQLFDGPGLTRLLRSEGSAWASEENTVT